MYGCSNNEINNPQTKIYTYSYIYTYKVGGNGTLSGKWGEGPPPVRKGTAKKGVNFSLYNETSMKIIRSGASLYRYRVNPGAGVFRAYNT